MFKIKEFFRSPHIQIALATGISIIVMAIFSKRILPEPIGYLSLAIPPFIATIFELFFEKHRDSKLLTPWYWVLVILISTVIVICFHS
jgi:predicted histidine transporter YuiF (NhaC family)